MTVTTKKDSIYYGRDRERIRCPGYQTMQLLFFYFLRMKNCGTHRQMSDTGIYFNQVRLGSVTLEQYILFHAAKDAYHGTKHIRLSELTDRELVPDEILRLIVNAFVIERYGMDIVEQKMCEEILEERNYTVLAQS